MVYLGRSSWGHVLVLFEILSLIEPTTGLSMFLSLEPLGSSYAQRSWSALVALAQEGGWRSAPCKLGAARCARDCLRSCCGRRCRILGSSARAGEPGRGRGFVGDSPAARGAELWRCCRHGHNDGRGRRRGVPGLAVRGAADGPAAVAAGG